MESLKGAIEPLQGIELLVNNAGVASLEPFLEITPGEFDRYVLSVLTTVTTATRAGKIHQDTSSFSRQS